MRHLRWVQFYGHEQSEVHKCVFLSGKNRPAYSARTRCLFYLLRVNTWPFAQKRRHSRGQKRLPPWKGKGMKESSWDILGAIRCRGRVRLRTSWGQVTSPHLIHIFNTMTHDEPSANFYTLVGGNKREITSGHRVSLETKPNKTRSSGKDIRVRAVCS